MNVKLTAVVLFLLLLSACQNPARDRSVHPPLAATTLPSDLHAVTAPQQIGNWRYLGNLIAEQRGFQLLRYQLDTADPVDAELTVYAMAAGWHEADPERIILGHFPLVAEQAAQQLLKRGLQNVNQQPLPLSRSSVTRYPIASARLQAHGPRRSYQQLLLLTGKPPWLVQLRVNGASDTLHDNALRLLEGFVEQL